MDKSYGSLHNKRTWLFYAFTIICFDMVMCVANTVRCDNILECLIAAFYKYNKSAYNASFDLFLGYGCAHCIWSKLKIKNVIDINVRWLITTSAKWEDRCYVFVYTKNCRVIDCLKIRIFMGVLIPQFPVVSAGDV